MKDRNEVKGRMYEQHYLSVEMLAGRSLHVEGSSIILCAKNWALLVL